MFDKYSMEVLITCPRLSLGGGVSNYYNVIKDFFSIKTTFFELGALKENERPVFKIKHLWTDRSGFNEILRDKVRSYDLIHLNPSFNYKSIVRDGLLLKLAYKYNKKTIVMFHGWSDENVKVIEKYFLRPFLSVYNRSNAFIVLASDFKNKLREWGFAQPIYLETTPVDDSLLCNFSIKDKINNINSGKDIKLLYLARIEKEKGIFETLHIFKLLLEKYPNIHLMVAGDGSLLGDVRKYKKGLLKDKIFFLGYIEGEEKKKILQNSSIYIFPTYHGEGMPTTVLEAMAFGLPVVTRPVGGLKDFFINGKHGFISESKDPEVLASHVERIIENKELWKKISVNAHTYAKKRFLASQVAKRLENIYLETLAIQSKKDVK